MHALCWSVVFEVGGLDSYGQVTHAVVDVCCTRRIDICPCLIAGAASLWLVWKRRGLEMAPGGVYRLGLSVCTNVLNSV